MSENPPSAAVLNATQGACFCRRVRRTANRLTRYYDRELAPHGLTVGQFGMLATLCAIDGASVQTLADGLDMNQSALSRGLAPLEREGLIASTPDARDGRKRQLSLTDAGHARFAQAAETWQRAQDRIAEALDALDLRVDDVMDQIKAVGRAAV